MPVNNNNRKFTTSKVDEKLRAAEARRAEMERVKAEELQKKRESRQNRVLKKSSSTVKDDSENTTPPPTAGQIALSRQKNVRECEYLRLANGRHLRLNWSLMKKKTNSIKKKLFTIKCIESLIKKEQFDLAEVILGILKRSLPARHLIQNKFAHLYGQIVEVKERNRRVFSHDSALNFTGSISPVRLPDFEADLNALSKVSSPIDSELAAVGRLYADVSSLPTMMKQQASIDHHHYEQYEQYEQDHHNDYDTAQNYSPEHESHVQGASITPPPLMALENCNDLTNFPTIISPLKRPHRDIEADTVYTPQRKSARRLEDHEMQYDEDRVSSLLLNDPNAAFISNPYITMTPTKKPPQKSPRKQ